MGRRTRRKIFDLTRSKGKLIVFTTCLRFLQNQCLLLWYVGQCGSFLRLFHCFIECLRHLFPTTCRKHPAFQYCYMFAPIFWILEYFCRNINPLCHGKIISNHDLFRKAYALQIYQYGSGCPHTCDKIVIFYSTFFPQTL